jgi:legumain
MIADDIANDPENPFPGRVYNRKDPGAVDVYAGLKMSYTGKSVNSSNFLAVLRGNATGVAGGSGEVLRSDAKSDVFVAYFDHGASGILGMPSGPFLYASDLNDTLNYMHEQGLYGQLTLYIEACESGSMFEGILSPNMSIYATTASNADESSWGWYCPPDDVVNGTELNTCLGDLYSINWMQNADAPSDSQETLEQQFQIVKNLTVRIGAGARAWCSRLCTDGRDPENRR